MTTERSSHCDRGGKINCNPIRKVDALICLFSYPFSSGIAHIDLKAYRITLPGKQVVPARIPLAVFLGQASL